MTYSKTRVDKAGERLRKSAHGHLMPEWNDQEEQEILNWWRDQHGPPMQATTMFVRSAYQSVLGRSPNGGAVVSRHKRSLQIIKKLARQRTRLTQMEDIGGCRAVVNDLAELESLAERLREQGRKMDVPNDDDYISNPQGCGYRALHLHARRDDRRIEIQIRTRWQHEWATLLEALDEGLGTDCKHGDGPPGLLEGLQEYGLGLHATFADDLLIFGGMMREHGLDKIRDELAERLRQ